jgi:hypothetical protein
MMHPGAALVLDGFDVLNMFRQRFLVGKKGVSIDHACARHSLARGLPAIWPETKVYWDAIFVGAGFHFFFFEHGEFSIQSF